MALLSLDQEKCIGCNACVETCPIGVVEIGEDGVREREPELCVGCGHCVAVCPTGALDHVRTPLAAQEPVEKSAWDAGEIKGFMRYRRSIRSYRDEAVPREKLLQLLDIARFAPSGSNSQGLSYLVISDKEKLRRITGITIDWMRQIAEAGGGPGVVFQRYGKSYVDRFRETGKDLILRDAPHLIVARSPEELGLMGRGSARFALEYVELYAPVLGLGTCWMGLVEGCAFSGYGPMLEALEIPAGLMAAGVMTVGYPRHVYHRLVDRNPLEVYWA